MTVHKALAELKVIDDRITKAIQACRFAVANKHCNDKIDGKPVSEYLEQQNSNYQSACDLIKRRNAIKRALVLSNASTPVTICGVSYTVAEAIDMKNHGLEHKKDLTGTMTRQLLLTKGEVEKRNGNDLEERVNAYIVANYGRQTDLKGLTDEMRRDRDTFITNQTYDLLMPFNVDDAIKKLDDEINSFAMEVDAALSVSNAITEITISY